MEPVVSVIKQVTLVLFGSRIQSNLLLSGGSFYFPMYSFFFLCVVKAIIRWILKFLTFSVKIIWICFAMVWELVFICFIFVLPSKQFKRTLYSSHFKTKIIPEETYDLFDLILMTPEGLQGGRVAHNGSLHCFFLVFCCLKESMVHLVFLLEFSLKEWLSLSWWRHLLGIYSYCPS